MSDNVNTALKIDALQDVPHVDGGTAIDTDRRLLEAIPKTGILSSSLSDEPTWMPGDLRQWLSTEPPVMDFLFENIFPAGIAAGLCGTGGVGKSTFILQLGYSLATGMTVFPSLVPPQPRPVMIFLGEDPKNVTWQRVRNIAKRFPMSPEQEELLHQNLHVYPQRAKPLCTLDGGQVCPTDAYKKMQLEVMKVRPALLIIDPKSRWSVMNENSNDEATAFVGLLEELVRPHGTSILMTHHVAKTSKDSLKATGRGASALADALRLVFCMVRRSSDDDESVGESRILLDTSKNNFAPRLQKAIELQHCDGFDGVLEQVIDDQRLQLLNIAMALTDWLTENGPINMSAILDARKAREIALREFLEERCGSYRRHVEDAVAMGQEEGLLIVETKSTRGRPARKVSAARNGGNTPHEDFSE